MAPYGVPASVCLAPTPVEAAAAQCAKAPDFVHSPSTTMSSAAARKASASLFSFASLDAARTRATPKELAAKVFDELRDAVRRERLTRSCPRAPMHRIHRSPPLRSSWKTQSTASLHSQTSSCSCGASACSTSSWSSTTRCTACLSRSASRRRRAPSASMCPRRLRRDATRRAALPIPRMNTSS